VERALTRARPAEFRDAGLDHVQLSIQDADTAPADAVAGRRAHEHKLVVAGVVKDLGLPLTVNAVLHRGNVSGCWASPSLAHAWAPTGSNLRILSSTAGRCATSRPCC
jgi:pyrroloquinoline quinone biosynthesis protein E